MPETVIESKEIGDEYQEALSNVSGYLIDPNNDDLTFVDFVGKDDEPEDSTVRDADADINQVVSEILDNTSGINGQTDNEINKTSKNKTVKKQLNDIDVE